MVKKLILNYTIAIAKPINWVKNLYNKSKKNLRVWYETFHPAKNKYVHT